VWVAPELEEIDGMLKPVEQKLPQVHDTNCKEAKNVPSRFQDWSEEDLLDYLMECDV
jgi:arsenate reductase-like glutaredoxin family protein